MSQSVSQSVNQSVSQSSLDLKDTFFYRSIDQNANIFAIRSPVRKVNFASPYISRNGPNDFVSYVRKRFLKKIKIGLLIFQIHTDGLSLNRISKTLTFNEIKENVSWCHLRIRGQFFVMTISVRTPLAFTTHCVIIKTKQIYLTNSFAIQSVVPSFIRTVI